MKKEFGVTIISEKGSFTVEVDDIETSEVVKTYDDEFKSFNEATKFVHHEVEKEFNLMTYHVKEIEDEE